MSKVEVANVTSTHSEDDHPKEISRRSMLKTVATGALAAAGGFALNTTPT
jgi:hypothetical protein